MATDVKQTDSMSGPKIPALDAAKIKTGPARSCPAAGVKTCQVKFKTGGDLAEGEFLGYAAVFDNKDMDGDVVLKGAFTNSLTEFASKGVPIPLLWGHNTSDPDFNLGVVAAEEDDHGLKVHGTLDMECPKAAQTYRLLKSGRVRQMSFAYQVIDGAFIMPEGEGKTYADSYYELRELKLFEVSVVPIGANQETEILAVKSIVSALAAKAGRVLSAANVDLIKGAIAQLESALEALESVLPEEDEDPADEDQNETSGKEPPPETGKSSDPATLSPSVSLAQIEMQLLEMELI